MDAADHVLRYLRDTWDETITYNAALAERMNCGDW